MSKTRGLQNMYACPNRLTATRCSYRIPEDAALRVLAAQIPAIEHRATRLIARIKQSAAAGQGVRIQQTIRAKQGRYQWIHENLIQPCMTAGVRADPTHVIEYARLGEEIDNLTRALHGLTAQTEALNSSISVLALFDGALEEAVCLLDAQGQAELYRALVRTAYLAGLGRAGSRSHVVRRITMVGEDGICS